jgi:hypothetical protein
MAPQNAGCGVVDASGRRQVFTCIVVGIMLVARDA